MSDRLQKEVRYINKDFSSFRADLVEFAKQYYPNTYNDFNEASPGMMFIEMASYVGDVLSYYVDTQFKEMLLAYAEDTKSIYEMAQTFGYKPKLSYPAFTNVDVFQTVPASGTGTNVKPNLNYGLVLKESTQVQSTNGVTFRLREDVNFRYSSSFDPTEISVFETDPDTKQPTFYLLKKSVGVQSGAITTENFEFGNATKYARIKLGQDKILEIISCVDSEGNTWKEVPFLAQDTIFDSVENVAANDPSLSQYNDEAPYILKLLKTPRRFVTFVRSDGKIELRFGSGISDSADEEIIPNPNSVGSSLPGSPTYLDKYFDPENFLNTKAYGQAPSNTTLTIKYSYGGGVGDNVSSNSITNVTNFSFSLDETSLDNNLVSVTKESVGVTNPYPASGGRNAETVKEIKENSLAYFQAQGRSVTKEDYITRTYAMPAKFGAVAKAYLVQDEQLNVPNMQIETKVGSGVFIDERNIDQLKAKDMANTIQKLPNPMAMNLYILGLDGNNKLAQLNVAVKENLKTYLSQYRIVTDAVNIKNAWVINIGVKFSFISRRGFNKEEVTLRCVERVKEFFNIEKWQINQPIILQELAYQISLVDGVGAIIPPKQDNPKNMPVLIYNKYDTSTGYSGNIYDINYAEKDGVIYPSLDPSCFELKYPNSDIEGRSIGDSIGNVF
jgi:hypothetical protein|tara:strand:- start:3614 stop:5623 length:2010 start_codon:yes stop_codon:yes gene_type:complete